LQGRKLRLNLVAGLRGLRDLLLSACDLCLQLTLLLINPRLQFPLLLFQIGLFRGQSVSIDGERPDPLLQLPLLLREPLPLATEVRQLSLSGRLGLARLLKATFCIGKFSCLPGEFLCSSAEVLTSGCFLLPDFLELTRRVSGLARPRHTGLLCGGNFPPDGCQALLGLRQLALQVRETLRQSCDIPVDLSGPLFGGLQLLLGGGGLGLGLCSHPRDFGQLLLLCLNVLQNSRELRLGLLAGLCDLRQLLLGTLQRLLQGYELSLQLVARLRSLCELLLGRLGRL
jgi:hypothetical protein